MSALFIDMRFTVEEWRLIAAACASVKRTSIIDPDGKKQEKLKQIAHKIAEETGKVR